MNETAKCLRCGHPRSAFMSHWCDSMIPGTGILCCDGYCVYAGEPGSETVVRTDWPTQEPR